MKKFDIAVVVGEYEKDGKKVPSWRNIGEIHQGESGKFYALLDPCFNLAGVPRKDGRDRVMASLFEPRARGERGRPNTPPSQAPKQDADFNDPLPF